MNEQMLLDNYLLLLKSTVEVYVHGTLESTNVPVRKLLQECLNSTMDMQKTTYDDMTSKGWYTIENVSLAEIKKVLKKIQNQN